MKTITKIIYPSFGALVLAMGTLIANGATGDLIVPISHGSIVRVPLNPVGTPTFVWDNGNLPPHFWKGIACDPAGNLYVSEDPDGHLGTGQIYKLPPDRSTLNLFATGLSGPRGLAVDTAGNLYEADEGSGNIYKFAPDGARSTFFSGCISGGQIVFDSQGNLFVPSCAIFPDPPDCQPPDCFYDVGIYKIDPQGGVTVPYVLDAYWGAAAIAFDINGNLWVVSHNGFGGANEIFEFPLPGRDNPVCYEYFGIPSTGGLAIDNFDN